MALWYFINERDMRRRKNIGLFGKKMTFYEAVAILADFGADKKRKGQGDGQISSQREIRLLRSFVASKG